VTLRTEQELYLANIAVAPDWRRRGVGRFTLERVEALARRLGCARITLDVQERNLAAQLLYRAMGFLAVQIKHGHYGSQDGYRMQKELPPPDDGRDGSAGQSVQLR
jgi:ribosomal protein S18 acetylase RimI-like enzyme